MRPTASHAAMSSVGKHTARESEAPNVVRMGKSAWRAPTPEFGQDPARGPGLFLSIENHFSLSVRRAGPGPEPTYPSRVRRADLSGTIRIALEGPSLLGLRCAWLTVEGPGELGPYRMKIRPK
jgi:hypothetical protein